MSNEISLVSGSEGVSHNGIFRGKDLGTISSLNEYIAFRTAHGIDDKSYKDLYLGDYFKIQDGTYNAVWMVAHFDYYNNLNGNKKSVILLPRYSKCAVAKMNTSNTTAGGYQATLTNTSTLPAIASAVSTVLGSYLISNSIITTNAVNDNILSMIGDGITGGATGWSWISTQCVLPTEPQIYGGAICSSSYMDIGIENRKLAVFNFINFLEYDYDSSFWLRNIASSSQFAIAASHGAAVMNGAGNNSGIRPIICIS